MNKILMELDEEAKLFCREDIYGEKFYYRNEWEKIEDNHYPECPVSIGASKKTISTLCICDLIKIANDSVVPE